MLPAALHADAVASGRYQDPATLTFGPLYRHPRKIWGIGLNYRDHAKDLEAIYPDEPASFIKGDQTIIGPGDVIELPPESQRVTAEAELGVIIDKPCRRVSEADALSYVAGYCLILDMTAEDILQRNPRYLTRSKNFDTFFSFGPELVTTDEVADVLALGGRDVEQRETASRQPGGQHAVPAGAPGVVPFACDDAVPGGHHLDGDARRRGDRRW